MTEPFSTDLCPALNRGECPTCKAPVADFRMGPRGGAAQNVCCPACWTAYNVVKIEGTFVLAQRIPNDWFRSPPRRPVPDRMVLDGPLRKVRDDEDEP